MTHTNDKNETRHARAHALAAALCHLGVLAGCEKPSMSNGSVAMTKDDLEAAYRVQDPLFAGQQAAEAVVVGTEGITVLASANPKGEANHTWLLRLDLDGAITWQHHYDPKYGAGRAIAYLPGGGLGIVGEVQRSPTAYQATLVTTTPLGEIVAARAFGPRGVAGLSSLQVRPDGSLLAGGAAPQAWLVTSDPALQTQASHTLAAADIKTLGIQPDGNIAVLAVAERSTSSFGRATLLSLGPNLAPRWQHDLPTKEHGDPAALAVQPDGVLAVGSGATDERARAHVWLAFADNAGVLRWERTLTASPNNARAWAAVALPDGYAIAGEIATPDGIRTPHVWRLEKDGTPRWQQGYPVPATTAGQVPFDIFNSIAAAPDGSFILVGSTLRGAGKTNAWIVRISRDGELLWERMFGSAADARG